MWHYGVYCTFQYGWSARWIKFGKLITVANDSGRIGENTPMISICQNADIVNEEAVWIGERIKGPKQIQFKAHMKCHDLE